MIYMDFSEALKYCKVGKKITRTGWNGKGMFVVYQKGYPDGIPCNEYTSVFFNGILYPRYPILNYKTSEDIEGMFTDTMRMFSTYLAAMGADYDGDQISTQGVFTQEGNEDVYKHMKEISNVVGINGNIMREFPNVIPHGIYGLTYMIPKPVAK